MAASEEGRCCLKRFVPTLDSPLNEGTNFETVSKCFNLLSRRWLPWPSSKNAGSNAGAVSHFRRTNSGAVPTAHCPVCRSLGGAALKTQDSITPNPMGGSFTAYHQPQPRPRRRQLSRGRTEKKSPCQSEKKRKEGKKGRKEGRKKISHIMKSRRTTRSCHIIVIVSKAFYDLRLSHQPKDSSSLTEPNLNFTLASKLIKPGRSESQRITGTDRRDGVTHSG